MMLITVTRACVCVIDAPCRGSKEYEKGAKVFVREQTKIRRMVSKKLNAPTGDQKVMTIFF